MLSNCWKSNVQFIAYRFDISSPTRSDLIVQDTSSNIMVQSETRLTMARQHKICSQEFKIGSFSIPDCCKVENRWSPRHKWFSVILPAVLPVPYVSRLTSCFWCRAVWKPNRALKFNPSGWLLIKVNLRWVSREASVLRLLTWSVGLHITRSIIRKPFMEKVN